MDSDLYDQIINEYEQLRKIYFVTGMNLILKNLVSKFCTESNSKLVNEEVIRSIISYKYQVEQKESSRKINWNLVFTDYEKGFNLLSIAASSNTSPALVSQRIINHRYSSSTIPSKLKEYHFNSNQIEDCFLAYESMLANYADSFNGIHNTQVANNRGQLFEQQVEDYLKKAGVDFMSEDELRKKKYDVTPDFKLNMPVILERHYSQLKNGKRKCIKNYLITKPIEFQSIKTTLITNSPLDQLIEENTKREIINWIECKSLFANKECHREYVQNQYNSYANRFGKGIIIYNYGCIDTILEEDTKFIILTELPELK